MKSKNVVICPPCGGNVALATKRGANKKNLFLPLLPCLTAVLPPQGREITTRGFTLIELLVVVLIIGILAAVAVPQYKKAVYKSRYNALKPLVKALADAEEVYYLSNGKYASTIKELDIDFPEAPSNPDATNGVYYFPSGACVLQITGITRVQCANYASELTYAKILQHPASYPQYAGMQKCRASDGNPTAIQICQQESGLTQGNHPVPGNELNSYYW